jgi:hypothetical protein
MKKRICQITPNDNEKITERQQDVCISCGGKWPTKLQLSKHWHTGCDNASFYPMLTKHVHFPIYLKFKFA